MNTPETDAMASMRRTLTEWRAHSERLERERDEARKVAEFWLAVACGPFEHESALPWRDEK